MSNNGGHPALTFLLTLIQDKEERLARKSRQVEVLTAELKLLRHMHARAAPVPGTIAYQMPPCNPQQGFLSAPGFEPIFQTPPQQQQQRQRWAQQGSAPAAAAGQAVQQQPSGFRPGQQAAGIRPEPPQLGLQKLLEGTGTPRELMGQVFKEVPRLEELPQVFHPKGLPLTLDELLYLGPDKVGLTCSEWIQQVCSMMGAPYPNQPQQPQQSQQLQQPQQPQQGAPLAAQLGGGMQPFGSITASHVAPQQVQQQVALPAPEWDAGMAPQQEQQEVALPALGWDIGMGGQMLLQPLQQQAALPAAAGSVEVMLQQAALPALAIDVDAGMEADIEDTACSGGLRMAPGGPGCFFT